MLGPRQPKIQPNTVAPEAIIPKSTGRFKLDDVDDFEVARQLALISFNFVCSIESKELATGAWGRSEGATLCPNIKKMLLRNRQLSGWVVGEVLKARKIKDRVKVFSRFVLIAQYLRDQHDFATCSALIDGMKNQAVSRLKHTIAELPKEIKKIYDELDRQFSPDGNYYESRALFQAASYPKTPYIVCV